MDYSKQSDLDFYDVHCIETKSKKIITMVLSCFLMVVYYANSSLNNYIYFWSTGFWIKIVHGISLVLYIYQYIKCIITECKNNNKLQFYTKLGD